MTLSARDTMRPEHHGRSTMRRLLMVGIVALLLLGRGEAGKFSCPAWTKLTDDAHLFPDGEQCDKYWTCRRGVSSRTVCPDGLAFHPDKEAGEDKCDMIHNIPDKCEGRPGRQRAKPGDAHCPRQNGQYPSDDPFECDVYYSCLNGVGSPTRCAEGLHYSEEIGTCVWPRESGRTGCSSAAERRKKTKKQQGPTSAGPTTAAPKALPNGFKCPGGKLGVHPALPHPTSCRLYYVCLDGATPTDAGCGKGKVFNPVSQMCDRPAAVPGCEDFYDPGARRKKQSLAESLDADPESGDFSKFLQFLRASGILKPDVAEKLSQDGLQLGGVDLRRPVGLQGTRGRGPRPRRLGRPGRRPGGKTRPGRRRPFRRPVDYDYQYEDDVSEESDRQSAAGGRERPRPKLEKQNAAASARTKAAQEALPGKESRTVPSLAEEKVNQVPLRKVPANRQNIFTSRFIPRVKGVGNTENLHPVALIREDFMPSDRENVVETRREQVKTITTEKPRLVQMSKRPKAIFSRPSSVGSKSLPPQPQEFIVENIADILDTVPAQPDSIYERTTTRTTTTTEAQTERAALRSLKRPNRPAFTFRNRQPIIMPPRVVSTTTQPSTTTTTRTPTTTTRTTTTTTRTTTTTTRTTTSTTVSAATVTTHTSRQRTLARNNPRARTRAKVLKLNNVELGSVSEVPRFVAGPRHDRPVAANIRLPPIERTQSVPAISTDILPLFRPNANHRETQQRRPVANSNAEIIPQPVSDSNSRGVAGIFSAPRTDIPQPTRTAGQFPTAAEVIPQFPTAADIPQFPTAADIPQPIRRIDSQPAAGPVREKAAAASSTARSRSRSRARRPLLVSATPRQREEAGREEAGPGRDEAKRRAMTLEGRIHSQRDDKEQLRARIEALQHTNKHRRRGRR